MQFKTKRKHAFTLVEILIVIAIIGLMAAIGIPNLMRARNSAQVRTCIDNLRQIDGAKQQWALEHRKPSSALPESSDLKPYMGRGGPGELPYCPNDDTHSFASSYMVNPVDAPPQCGINPDAHILKAN